MTAVNVNTKQQIRQIWQNTSSQFMRDRNINAVFAVIKQTTAVVCFIIRNLFIKHTRDNTTVVLESSVFPARCRCSTLRGHQCPINQHNPVCLNKIFSISGAVRNILMDEVREQPGRLWGAAASPLSAKRLSKLVVTNRFQRDKQFQCFSTQFLILVMTLICLWSVAESHY